MRADLIEERFVLLGQDERLETSDERLGFVPLGLVVRHRDELEGLREVRLRFQTKQWKKVDEHSLSVGVSPRWRLTSKKVSKTGSARTTIRKVARLR
jgi:hypothetical protein